MSLATSVKPDPALTNPLLRLKLRTRLAMSLKWIFALPEEREDATPCRDAEEPLRLHQTFPSSLLLYQSTSGNLVLTMNT